MINELKEVFELATSATVFTNEILKLKTNIKKVDKDVAVISLKGNSAQIGSSGDYAQIGSSGDYAQIGSSGDYAKIGSFGYNAKIGSSGNNAKIGSFGYNAQIGSSGNSAQIGSSGDYAQIGSSGDYAQIGSSGYNAKINSTGDKAVIASIGYNSIAKAKKGSWITLAEYALDENRNYVVDFVKTEKVDGEKIKEDTYYTLFEKEFKEVQIIDNTPTIIYQKRKNIIKGKFLNDKSNCFVFEKDGIYAHGNTVKQAYRDWLFKTSDRDVGKYENLDPKEIHDLDFWVIAYRTITGACSFGTNNFLENNKDKYKAKMTLNEVIKATEGQYGSHTFKEFFRKE